MDCVTKITHPHMDYVTKSTHPHMDCVTGNSMSPNVSHLSRSTHMQEQTHVHHAHACMHSCTHRMRQSSNLARRNTQGHSDTRCFRCAASLERDLRCGHNNKKGKQPHKETAEAHTCALMHLLCSRHKTTLTGDAATNTTRKE